MELIKTKIDETLVYERVDDKVLEVISTYFQINNTDKPNSLIFNIQILIVAIISINVITFVLYNRLSENVKFELVKGMKICMLVTIILIFYYVINEGNAGGGEMRKEEMQKEGERVGDIYSIVRKANPFYRCKQRKKIIILGDDFVDKFNNDQGVYSQIALKLKGTGDLTIE